MNPRRVVVTGMGTLTPIGLSVPAYWDGLRNGVNGVGPITRFDATKFKTRFACELKGYDVGQYIPVKEARRMDPFTHYALIAADEAIAHAGLNISALDSERIGVVSGSGIGGLLTFQEEVGAFYKGDGTPRFSPFFIPKMIVDIAAGYISMKHGLHGPNYASLSACATSAHCIADGFMLIKQDLADVMVVGGSEAAITESGVGGFNACKALSENNEEMTTASRPFDLNRDGFVLGEGSGMVILEELEHAKRRGATIYAELKGIGLTADAHHITAPHPEGTYITNVMRNALKMAGLQPEDIDYVNTHGTSTPLGDVAETKAIKNVFGDHAYKLNVSSTKSMTGHLLGAAGVIEAIAVIFAIVNDVIPPTINFQTPDPECDLNFTFNKAQERITRAAISNVFGFGGHNTCLLFTKFDEK